MNSNLLKMTQKTKHEEMLFADPSSGLVTLLQESQKQCKQLCHKLEQKEKQIRNLRQEKWDLQNDFETLLEQLEQAKNKARLLRRKLNFCKMLNTKAKLKKASKPGRQKNLQIKVLSRLERLGKLRFKPRVRHSTVTTRRKSTVPTEDGLFGRMSSRESSSNRKARVETPEHADEKTRVARKQRKIAFGVNPELARTSKKVRWVRSIANRNAHVRPNHPETALRDRQKIDSQRDFRRTKRIRHHKTMCAHDLTFGEFHDRGQTRKRLKTNSDKPRKRICRASNQQNSQIPVNRFSICQENRSTGQSGKDSRNSNESEKLSYGASRVKRKSTFYFGNKRKKRYCQSISDV